MSCLREVQTISKSPDILPMPSLTRLTTGGVLNPLKNTTNTSHNELLHQDPLQPPLEPRHWIRATWVHLEEGASPWTCKKAAKGLPTSNEDYKGTARLTVALAIIRFLSNQYTGRDGVELLKGQLPEWRSRDAVPALRAIQP